MVDSFAIQHSAVLASEEDEARLSTAVRIFKELVTARDPPIFITTYLNNHSSFIAAQQKSNAAWNWLIFSINIHIYLQVDISYLVWKRAYIKKIIEGEKKTLKFIFYHAAENVSGTAHTSGLVASSACTTWGFGYRFSHLVNFLLWLGWVFLHTLVVFAQFHSLWPPVIAIIQIWGYFLLFCLFMTIDLF